MCFSEVESPQSPYLRGFCGHAHSPNCFITTPAERHVLARFVPISISCCFYPSPGVHTPEVEFCTKVQSRKKRRPPSLKSVV